MSTTLSRTKHATRRLAVFEPFVGLSDDQSALLRSLLKAEEFARGERFIRAGEPGDSLYLIVEGQVEVRRPDDSLLARLGKGSFVGEMALLNQEPRVANVVASSNIRTWRLDRADFETLAGKLPELRLFLTQLIAHRLHWSGNDLLSRRIGRYEVIERIGEGGMGWVFRALQLPEEREVAVKMLPHPLVGRYGFLESFRLESRILNRLRHENIVAVYDTLEAYGTIFIVMEFVRGLTLRDRAMRHPKLSSETVRGIACSVASALQYAHKQGIVHRDVKPDNIMIRNDGWVKLMDFGISQQLEEGNKGFGGCTPQYASPEVLNSQQVTPAADIYSLGVTLYELLAGQLPFFGTSMSDWTRLHCQSQPPSLAQISPAIPADLQALVGAALLKDPTLRMKEFERNLTVISSPVKQPPPQAASCSCGPSQRLVWVRWTSEKDEHALLMDPSLLLGSGASADVRLDAAGASARHCHIRGEGADVVIEDLRSREGTFVNNRRVSMLKLKHGDKIRIGKTQLTVTALSKSGIHLVMERA